MSGRSSIDSLRRLTPVSDGEAAAVFGAAGREELLAGVTRLPLGSRQRLGPVTRRRRPLVLVLAVVVLLGTAAAAWAILGSSAQETTSVECVIAGTDTIVPSSSGDPAHDCAVTWKRDTGVAAPPLAAYDNGSGGVTVIPRSEKPQAGWKPLVSQDVALIQLQNSLDDYIAGLSASCLDAQAATALTRAKLAEFGFAGWAVSVRNSDSATTEPSASANAAPGIKSSAGMKTCVAFDIVDPATQSVTLIPVGVASGTTTTFEKLADRLRPLTRSCDSLPAAVAAVRAAAGSLGLSESNRTYELNAVEDNSLRCASVYETVGGTIFVTVRGPSG
jgi:hypothetical protein